MADDGLSFPIDIDLTAYSRSITNAIADAGALDAALASITQRAKGTQDVLGGFSDVDVSISLGLVNESVLADIGGLETLSPVVDITTTLEQTDISALAALETASYTPDIDPTFDDSALTALDGLDTANYSPDIDPETTASGEDVLDRLEQIRNQELISIALDIVGPGVGILQNALDLITANDAALAQLEARTGRSIPNASELIDELYVGTLSNSKEQIAQTLELATQLGLTGDPLKQASEGALNFATIFDQDVNESLVAANALVTSGLAKDFPQAFDLITAGFQDGLNRSGDFLSTLIEFSAPIAALGLDGSNALAAIGTGLDAGFDNASRVGDLLKELQIRITGTGDENALNTLESLGLPPPESVEDLGADYIEAILTGIRNQAQTDPTGAIDASRALFGSFAEDFGTEALTGIDPVDATFATIEARAQEAKDTFDNTLGATVETFFESARVAAENFLSSDQLGLQEKVQLLETGFQDAIAVLQEGGSLSDALTVGLKPLGFDDEFQKLESIFGNLIIGFLEVVASVQEVLGKDSSGTRAEIARLGAQQFAFDLQIADPDAISGVIKTALDRGVEGAALNEAVSTSVNELLASGEVGKAQQLIDALNQTGGAILQVTDPVTRKLLEDQGLDTTINVPLMPQMSAEEYQTFLDQKQAEFAAQGIPVDITVTDIDRAGLEGITTQVNEATALVQEQFDAAFAAGDLPLATQLAEQLGDEAALEQLRGIAAQYRTEFDEAIASGDIGKAQELAGLLGDADLQDQVDELTASVLGAKEAITTNAKDMEDALRAVGDTTTEVITGNTMVEDFATLHTSADEELQPVIDYVNTLEAAFTAAGQAASGFGLAGSTAIAGLAGAAAGAGNPFEGSGTSTIPLKAAGGEASGTFIAGEAGPELISTDSTVAVLNNASTRSLFAAVEAALGAPTVNHNTQRSQQINQHNTYYVQSMAQAGSAAQRSADAIRGFG